MTVNAYRSEILFTLDDPRVAGEDAVRHFSDGLLVVENGYVLDVGNFAELAPKLTKSIEITEFKNALITPGFIDAHIHYPQTDIIGAYGEQLLDWLSTYTFPAEAAFADSAHATQSAQFFVDELLRNGTTSAMVFATSHEQSVGALFDAALEKNMRLITGKVLMDRNAPDALCDGDDLGRAASERLIKKWRGRGRLGYALTPRFAPTSSIEQLEMAGAVLRDHPDVFLQTHLAENKDEIALTKKLFPAARDYLDVYDRAGLLTNRSVFAHALHMSDDAFGRIGGADASLACCPTSNMFLGSGLFDFEAAHKAGAKVALGTDVGAGVSFSMLRTLQAAYQTAQLKSADLDPFTMLYLATLSGAKAMGAADKIGQLSVGAEADFIVLDYTATPLLTRRMAAAKDLRERLFALMIMGDDRAVARSYVAGACVHKRDEKTNS